MPHAFQIPGNIIGSLTLMVVLQFIAFPIMLVSNIIITPFKLVFSFLGQNQRYQSKDDEEEIHVEIHEECKNPIDDLLFVHGWPDNARLWDNQIKVLKHKYRCIVLTMPNCGEQKNSQSWGVGFPEIA